jgi:hypothetical protein
VPHELGAPLSCVATVGLGNALVGGSWKVTSREQLKGSLSAGLTSIACDFDSTVRTETMDDAVRSPTSLIEEVGWPRETDAGGAGALFIVKKDRPSARSLLFATPSAQRSGSLSART